MFKNLCFCPKGGAAGVLVASLVTLLATSAFAQNCTPGETDCCGPDNPNDCCEETQTPGTGGCNDADCCFSVCYDPENGQADSFCCETNWDQSCADQAIALCGCPPAACTPDAGACDQANGSPGCDDPDCCAAVCACDPFCCDVEWDAFCVGPNGAVPGCSWLDLCQPPCNLEGPCGDGGGCFGDTNGDNVINVDDLVNVILDWGTNGAANGGDVNGSGLVDVDDLVDVILAWGPCPPNPGPPSEGEACGDDSNGGCNSTPPAFESVSPGTICGTAWAADGTRDTDWYQIVVPGGSTCNRITASASAEFSADIFVIDASDCALINILGDPGSSANCAPGASAVALVEPGTYVVFIASTAFEGNPCGTGFNDYQLNITVEALDPIECACDLENELGPCTGTPEGEVCNDSGAPDNVNGGCNSTPPVFGAIACGETICGVGWANGGTRDTDWHQIVAAIAPATEITADLTSEFSGVVFIVDGIAGCAPVVVGTTGSSHFCSLQDPPPADVAANATVSPGTYVIFVATADFDGSPCGAFGGTGNDYRVTATCSEPGGGCELNCPGGSIPEGEPCVTGGVDTINGGCNSTPPVFGAIEEGQTVCGSGWAAAGTRDTDWLEIIADGATLSATLTSEFTGVVFIVDGIDACAPVVLGDPGDSADCAPGLIASAAGLTPGANYAIFVAPSVFDGFPCGTSNDYFVSVGP